MKTASPGKSKNLSTMPPAEGLSLTKAPPVDPRISAVCWTTGNCWYFLDFPFIALGNAWFDTQSGGIFAGRDSKIYVVQTNARVIARCLLMTTDPGDLVLDPTCGSGTTAYVAEQWGRRWITMDTSLVPLALARQRLLTGSFPYYALADETRGPAGGFVYKRRQNKKGEEVGGIVPHITLKSIANDEPPAEEVLVDRPEEVKNVVRVTGPFTVEATIPSASQPSEFQVSSFKQSPPVSRLETRNSKLPPTRLTWSA